MKKNFEVQAIGVVAGNQIKLTPKWAVALKGIEGFSHIIVLCWLDRAKVPTLKIRVKSSKSFSEIGFLATRTPHRPNPIALSIVKLVKRKGVNLQVEGLDVWDGTPVIDIKPYTKRDFIQTYKIPNWVKILDEAETDPLRKYAT